MYLFSKHEPLKAYFEDGIDCRFRRSNSYREHSSIDGMIRLTGFRDCNWFDEETLKTMGSLRSFGAKYGRGMESLRIPR